MCCRTSTCHARLSFIISFGFHVVYSKRIVLCWTRPVSNLKSHCPPGSTFCCHEIRGVMRRDKTRFSFRSEDEHFPRCSGGTRTGIFEIFLASFFKAPKWQVSVRHRTWQAEFHVSAEAFSGSYVESQFQCMCCRSKHRPCPAQFYYFFRFLCCL